MGVRIDGARDAGAPMSIRRGVRGGAGALRRTLAAVGLAVLAGCENSATTCA